MERFSVGSSVMQLNRLSWPILINSVLCINILNIYNMRKEDYIMANLTISGLKNALNFVQENSREIKFHGKNKSDGQPDSKFGLIVTPEYFSDEDAYHLRVIQNLTPKLFTRLAEDYTVLSLDGQELLHVLNDDLYLSNLASRVKARGYTEASDVQVFKLLREKINNDEGESLLEVVTELLKDSISRRGKLVIESAKEEPDTGKTIKQIKKEKLGE